MIRRHWIVFAAMSLLLAVLIVPVIMLLIYWSANPDTFSGSLGNFLIILSSMYTLAVIGLMLYGFVNYYLDIYIVTNKRIVDIKQNGFFKREIAELHLHQIQDVEARVDGFLQTVIHFGDIYIQTAGERENFIFADVPHPYTLAKEIIELHEAAIEAEYEPQMPDDEIKADDYRPEDYSSGKTTTDQAEEQRFQQIQSQDNQIEDSGGAIKELEESYSPKDAKDFEQQVSKSSATSASDQTQPEVELGFGSHDSGNQQKNPTGELSEGQEVNLNDDHN